MGLLFFFGLLRKTFHIKNSLFGLYRCCNINKLSAISISKTHIIKKNKNKF